MAKIEIGLKGYVARAIARTTELGTGLELARACLGSRLRSCFRVPEGIKKVRLIPILRGAEPPDTL